MTDFPTDVKYAATHVWLREEGDVFAVGITDHAQELLGDLVYVGLPEVGARIDPHTECATVESVKAASEVIVPLAGVVTELNEALKDKPELINQSPYEAWLFKFKADAHSGQDVLLDAHVYQALLDAEE